MKQKRRLTALEFLMLTKSYFISTLFVKKFISVDNLFPQNLIASVDFIPHDWRWRIYTDFQFLLPPNSCPPPSKNKIPKSH